MISCLEAIDMVGYRTVSTTGIFERQAARSSPQSGNGQAPLHSLPSLVPLRLHTEEGMPCIIGVDAFLRLQPTVFIDVEPRAQWGCGCET